mmetsp:Transcript_33831/g.87997  ORF Transcript_33831/g.87997 Transcript_33831/m.87997 type:complete len:102 (-) Transcript_33831:1309-1614(-)
MDSTVLRVLQAAADGDAEVVAGLLSQGTCPNSEGTFGQRPAHAAAEAGNAAVLGVLIQAKADVSAKKQPGPHSPACGCVCRARRGSGAAAVLCTRAARHAK